MSNSLAVATVTAALGQVILDAASQDVTDAEVHVSYYRPGSEPAGAEKTRINVFLYGVTPNPAWRNDEKGRGIFFGSPRLDTVLIPRPEGEPDA